MKTRKKAFSIIEFSIELLEKKIIYEKNTARTLREIKQNKRAAGF